MPTATFYNLGASGGGNLFISNRLTEVNRKFKLTEDDLVMVLWSTYTREDRFVNSHWLLPGNIYSQGNYDGKFVKEFCDPIGYLIRDLSLIDISLEYMKALPSTCVSLMSVPVHTHQIHSEYQAWIDPFAKQYSEVAMLYKDIIDLHKLTLLDSLKDQEWPTNIKYYDEDRKQDVTEYHPSPKQYYEFLMQLGFNMSPTTKQYALDAEEVLLNIKSHKEFKTQFSKDIDVVINNVHASSTNGFINWL